MGATASQGRTRRQRGEHIAAEHADPRSLAGDALAAAACTAAGPAFLLLARALSDEDAVTGVGRLEHLLALGCAAVGLALCLLWAGALACTLLWVLASRRRSRHAAVLARWSPTLLRRLAGAVLGAQMALAPTSLADQPPSAAWLPSAPPASVSATDQPPHARWLPAAPASAPPGHTAPPREETSAPTVTVVDGDCLWDLAAAELGPDATALEVDARWRQWHRHNREVIGEDPHLLYTGTVLEVPPHSGRLPEEDR